MKSGSRGSRFFSLSPQIPVEPLFGYNLVSQNGIVTLIAQFIFLKDGPGYVIGSLQLLSHPRIRLLDQHHLLVHPHNTLPYGPLQLVPQRPLGISFVEAKVDPWRPLNAMGNGFGYSRSIYLLGILRRPKDGPFIHHDGHNLNVFVDNAPR